VKLKDGYAHQLHLIWLGWRPWLIRIHMEPSDGWWVAWTWGYKYVVFGDSSEEALEKIKRAIRK